VARPLQVRGRRVRAWQALVYRRRWEARPRAVRLLARRRARERRARVRARRWPERRVARPLQVRGRRARRGLGQLSKPRAARSQKRARRSASVRVEPRPGVSRSVTQCAGTTSAVRESRAGGSDTERRHVSFCISGCRSAARQLAAGGRFAAGSSVRPAGRGGLSRLLLAQTPHSGTNGPHSRVHDRPPWANRPIGN
jgi:hypothetical protein